MFHTFLYLKHIFTSKSFFLSANFKNKFLLKILPRFSSFFSFYQLFCPEKHLKGIFQPVIRVLSTQMLVEIYNHLSIDQCLVYHLNTGRPPFMGFIDIVVFFTIFFLIFFKKRYKNAVKDGFYN